MAYINSEFTLHSIAWIGSCTHTTTIQVPCNTSCVSLEFANLPQLPCPPTNCHFLKPINNSYCLCSFSKSKYQIHTFVGVLNLKCVKRIHFRDCRRFHNYKLSHYIFYLMSPILLVLLNTNCKPAHLVSPTLNVNLPLFAIPCKKKLGIVNLQCRNYCQLLNIFHPYFTHPWKYFITKILDAEYAKLCPNLGLQTYFVQFCCYLSIYL